MSRVAVIDIGTVTSRLAVADVVDGRVTHLEKLNTITDLGEGLVASGRLAPAAIGRVTDAVTYYVGKGVEAGADAFATTLTSAARDAANSAELTDQLRDLGLDPQVIPGVVEGSLTFLGVAGDAPAGPLLVADSGGGSTELALGELVDGRIRLADVRSLDVGCRRVTELFLQREDPPSAEAIAEARAWCAAQFVPQLAEVLALADARPRLYAVAGTVTTLTAIHGGVVPYDSSRIHNATLAREVVDALAERLLALPLAERAQVPGLQPKRAPVIGAGAVVIGELMRAGGFAELTVSEHDLLYGLSQACDAALEGTESPVGWLPRLSRPSAPRA